MHSPQCNSFVPFIFQRETCVFKISCRCCLWSSCAWADLYSPLPGQRRWAAFVEYHPFAKRGTRLTSRRPTPHSTFPFPDSSSDNFPGTRDLPSRSTFQSSSQQCSCQPTLTHLATQPLTFRRRCVWGHPVPSPALWVQLQTGSRCLAAFVWVGKVRRRGCEGQTQVKTAATWYIQIRCLGHHGQLLDTSDKQGTVVLSVSCCYIGI